MALTKDLDKEHHSVNGMTAVVEDFDVASNSIVVRTETGYTCSPSTGTWTTTYPLDNCVLSTASRLCGYDLQIAGAELPHVRCGRLGCPAGGYVTLSRVKYDKDYLIGGVATFVRVRRCDTLCLAVAPAIS